MLVEPQAGVEAVPRFCCLHQIQHHHLEPSFGLELPTYWYVTNNIRARFICFLSRAWVGWVVCLSSLTQRRADEESLYGRPEGGRRTSALIAWPETAKSGVRASDEP